MNHEFLLEVPVVGEAVPLVQSHARALGAQAGFAGAQLDRIELVCEEAFVLILDRADAAGQSRVRIEASLSPLALEIRFDDREIPPLPADSATEDDPESVGQRLIRAIADRAEWQPLGRGGNRLKLSFDRPVLDIVATDGHSALPQFNEQAPLAPEQEYVIRRASEPGDWPRIARVMYRTYGFSYPVDDFYVPERIRELNQGGYVMSVVATTLGGEVVGHYALDVKSFGKLGDGSCATGELGKAVVDPSHRGRSLMERMRSFTEQQAAEEGLLAVFSQPTMAHPYSQKANEKLGARACAVSLAMVGVNMELKSIDKAGGDRTSVLLYLQPLTKPALRKVHLPERHREMLARTYQGCEIEVQPLAPAPPPPESELSVIFVGMADFGLIEVSRCGEDISHRLRAARDELVRRSGTRVIYLDLCLEDPNTDLACEVAGWLGFFYAGLAPLFSRGRDVLRLQYVDVPLEVGSLAVAGPFAKEIVDYAAADRARVEAL
ncbi:MAG: ATP-binding protein [Steroidobacteraceae bacterium]